MIVGEKVQGYIARGGIYWIWYIELKGSQFGEPRS